MRGRAVLRLGLAVLTASLPLAAADGPGPAEPDAQAVASLQLLNRFRADPRGEAGRLLRWERYGVPGMKEPDLALFRREMAALPAAPPLVFEPHLVAAAHSHASYLVRHKLVTRAVSGHSQDPQLAGFTGALPVDRLAAAGYGGTSTGENVHRFATSPLAGQQGLIIDWGEGPGGMLPGRGHRITSADPQSTEVGIALVLIRVYARLVHRLHVDGQDHIAQADRATKDHKPLIIVANHTAGVDPIRITKLDAGGKAFTVTLQTLQEGKRYAVSFVTDPELPLGTHRQKVRLTTDNAQQPTLDIPLEVTVVPAVTFNPATLVFDNVPVSDPELEISLVSKFLWIRLGRGTGLEVTGITSDLPFVKVKQESNDGNGSQIIMRVGFSEKPPKGTHTGVLKVQTNNPMMKATEIPITVTAK